MADAPPRANRGVVGFTRDPLHRFLAAATLSQYGDWLTTVALVVVVVRVTGSAAAPAGYMVARVLPRLFGAGPGGAFADRYSGTRVVAGCSVVQAGLTAAIIPAEHAGSAVGIYSAIVGTQLASGIARSALGTIIPGVVPASQLGRANALFGLSTGSSLVVGPALGAPLFLIRGPDLLLGIDAATFVVAALVILRLPRTRVEPERARGAWESFRLVAADPPLRALGSAYLADSMVVTVANSVVVLAAIERLGGESVVGLLYAAVGVGDAIGALLTLRRRPPSSMRIAATAAAVVSILSVAVFSAAHTQWLAVLALVMSGIGSTAYITWGATDMQQRVAAGVLGRVNAVVVFSQSAGMALGAITALILVSVTHWDRALFTAACGGLVLLAALVLTGSAGGRRAVGADVRGVEGQRLSR